MRKRTVTILALLVIVSLVSLTRLEPEHALGKLDKFHSYDELKQFLLERANSQRIVYGSRFYFATTDASVSNLECSETNIQVQGVDEADIVKTDGEYAYVVSGQNLVIIKAYPVEDAAIISSIAFNTTLKQILVNGNRLIVFYQNDTWGVPYVGTSIDVYDVTDRSSPILKRQIKVDGSYVNSRMIGNYAYVILSKGAYVSSGEVELPTIEYNKETRTVPATDIYYASCGDYWYAFSTVLAFNSQEDSETPNEKTVLTGSSTVMYVSQEDIYLAVNSYDRTYIHRIHVQTGKITIDAHGQVPGTVLNQFSMDEHNGYLRIATTSPLSSSAQLPGRILQSQNNVYVLTMNLEVVGRLENIAPGETIHSVRFMGDIGYIVTFRKIDPFFVIDFSNPYIPVILGELKITGFSDYLHPYDANNVIGVGKETIPGDGDFSWFQGIKISLFDVTDKTDPIELAKFEIGGRGSESPVLYDHKAFLYNRERNLLVIPVLAAENKDNEPGNGVNPWIHNKPTFQGAYVFEISQSAAKKIVLKGTITHITGDDIWNSSKHVMRTFYIENILYTVSQHKIKMNLLSDLTELKQLDINASEA